MGGEGRFRGGGVQVGGMDQGGCECRIEVFCENSKKKIRVGVRGGGGRVFGVRVDVNGELKFFVKIQKRN